jgi:hypothetical protein
MKKERCDLCEQQIKECYVCEGEFVGGDTINCLELRGKHLCISEDCLVQFLRDRYEEKRIIQYASVLQ